MTDTGKGITDEEMNKLFKRFGKLKRTEIMNPEGLGMGLDICRRIVQSSGGEIQVFSEGVDKGATFMFSISMKEPQALASVD